MKSNVETAKPLTERQASILAFIDNQDKGIANSLKSHKEEIEAIRKIDLEVKNAYEVIIAYIAYWAHDPFARAPRDMYMQLNSAVLKVTQFLDKYQDFNENIRNRMQVTLRDCYSTINQDLIWVNHIKEVIDRTLQEKSTEQEA